jgi:23S rRNA (cytosine1962-C5)-methyltransferase
VLPCLLFEDEDLLVVNKPAGLNTHAPSPFAGEGIYEWLRYREPRWSNLAIIQRLDKETSGVLLFSKTPLANRSLTEQFTKRAVHKKYVLLTDRPPPQKELLVKTAIARAGDKYESRSLQRGGKVAETHFRLIHSPHSAKGNPSDPTSSAKLRDLYEIEAKPLTGRTHQIRVHAAEKGFPILGDTLYGGSPWPRVCLHADQLTLNHPATSEKLTFRAPMNFQADPRFALRLALFDPDDTNVFRLIHGASDNFPGWYVDRLGDYLLSQHERSLRPAQEAELNRLLKLFSLRGAYHKIWSRQVHSQSPVEASPQLILGERAPDRFAIKENGVSFDLSFSEGYSVGLFLDQRENRRRLLTGHVTSDFPVFTTETRAGGSVPKVLNTFAYTCGFSVCAGKAGAQTASLDLSKKYLEWGKRNFLLNSIDPAAHDFVYGDVFDWLKRLAKRQRLFELILLDPPTFSRSREHGVFRVEKDYGKLVASALPLLKPAGLLFASTNAADWEPEKFLAAIENAVDKSKRRILQRHYMPQPPDFPVSCFEPAYLKTIWLRIS